MGYEAVSVQLKVKALFERFNVLSENKHLLEFNVYQHKPDYLLTMRTSLTSVQFRIFLVIVDLMGFYS